MWGEFLLEPLAYFHNSLVRLNNFSEMFPFYPDLQWPRQLFSNNQIKSLKLKHFWKHSSFNPSLSSQLACQAKWWSTALQPEPTNRCGRVISFINPQFKYVHDILRDRPLFSLGGGGWEILKKKLSARSEKMK